MVVEEISVGRCIFSTTASGSDALRGPFTNGGICTTLLDFAMAAAVQSTIEPSASFRVVRFNIHIKQVDTPPRGRIEARAHAHAHGPRAVQASGLVVDRWGTIRAQATMFAATATDLPAETGSVMRWPSA